ncbi:MAG: hypothetical protein KAR42_14860 [candidate division Zixibacteria bacterium]|nr:hypothetical protein [candidate division Zixibacteria bacterium]
MTWEIALAIFMAFCMGIGALKVIISSVKNCIKQEMKGVVISKEDFKEMIDLRIAIHKDACPKK